MSVWVTSFEFQTNPRGVGGNLRSCSPTQNARFRPTLVGSEVRSLAVTLSYSGFRPTLVGSEAFDTVLVGGDVIVSDQPSWGRRLLMKFGKLQLMAFQTNPRGVGGTNPAQVVHHQNLFQTNPRGVGGITTKTGKKS